MAYFDYLRKVKKGKAVIGLRLYESVCSILDGRVKVEQIQKIYAEEGADRDEWRSVLQDIVPEAQSEAKKLLTKLQGTAKISFAPKKTVLTPGPAGLSCYVWCEKESEVHFQQ